MSFFSFATNFADGDTEAGDVFVRNRTAGTTTLASVNSDGTPANAESIDSAISANGHEVAFTSHATNLVPNDTNDIIDVFVRDLAP